MSDIKGVGSGMSPVDFYNKLGNHTDPHITGRMVNRAFDHCRTNNNGPEGLSSFQRCVVTKIEGDTGKSLGDILKRERQ